MKKPLKIYLRYYNQFSSTPLLVSWIFISLCVIIGSTCKFGHGGLFAGIFTSIIGIATAAICLKWEIVCKQTRIDLYNAERFISVASRQQEDEVKTLEADIQVLKRDILDEGEKLRVHQQQINEWSIENLNRENNINKLKRDIEEYKLSEGKLKEKNEQLILDKKAYMEDIAKREEAAGKLVDSIKNEYKKKLKAAKTKFTDEFLDLTARSYIINDDSLKYWKHYKGGVYKQIAVATNTDSTKDTGSEMVIYMSLINGEVYARSLSKFLSRISTRTAKAKGIQFKVGEPLPTRFEEISKEEAEYIAANWNHNAPEAEPAQENETAAQE